MRKMLTRLMGTAGGGTVKDPKNKADPAPRPRRKRVVPFWRRAQTRVAVVLLAGALAGGAGTWTARSGWGENVLNTTKWMAVKSSADLGFTVQDVLVTGRVETDRGELLDAVGVARGAPILSYDFQGAKQRVEALPWVLQARVERMLPDTLVVRIIERRPLAVWQNNAQSVLIDDTGAQITRDGLDRFANLIHIAGANAPDNVGGLLELLETQPDLKSMVKAAIWVGGRRWDLSLAGGIDVRLPELGAPQALARLAAFEAESGVLSRDVRVLDLRFPDRVIVRQNSVLGRGNAAPKAPPHRSPARQIQPGPGQET